MLILSLGLSEWLPLPSSTDQPQFLGTTRAWLYGQDSALASSALAFSISSRHLLPSDSTGAPSVCQGTLRALPGAQRPAALGAGHALPLCQELLVFASGAGTATALAPGQEGRKCRSAPTKATTPEHKLRVRLQHPNAFCMGWEVRPGLVLPCRAAREQHGPVRVPGPTAGLAWRGQQCPGGASQHRGRDLCTSHLSPAAITGLVTVTALPCAELAPDALHSPGFIFRCISTSLRLISVCLIWFCTPF